MAVFECHTKPRYGCFSQPLSLARHNALCNQQQDNFSCLSPLSEWEKITFEMSPVDCWIPALQTIVMKSNTYSNWVCLINQILSALQAYRVHLLWQVKMLPFFLIYNSAQWCTIGRVCLMWVCICCGSTGPMCCFYDVELGINEGKCVRKAFQGAGMTSCCIYHLLVLPPLSCWARWVTHYSLALISSSLLSFCYYISLFTSFFYTTLSLHLSLCFLLLLGHWNNVSP